MALLDSKEEARRFEERINSNFYSFDRAKNSGEDYVKSGKHKRDTKAVEKFAASDAFDAVRGM